MLAGGRNFGGNSDKAGLRNSWIQIMFDTGGWLGFDTWYSGNIANIQAWQRFCWSHFISTTRWLFAIVNQVLGNYWSKPGPQFAFGTRMAGYRVITRVHFKTTTTKLSFSDHTLEHLKNQIVLWCYVETSELVTVASGRCRSRCS